MELTVNNVLKEFEAQTRCELSAMHQNHQLDMANFWLGLVIEDTKDATLANTCATLVKAIDNLKCEV